MDEVRRCWLWVLIDVVARFDGAVIGHPSELVRDGREVAGDWLRCGWPATGHGLVKLLTGHAEELREAGLLVHYTEPGPGQPPWLAVTDLDAAPRRHPRLPAESYVPVLVPRGRRPLQRLADAVEGAGVIPRNPTSAAQAGRSAAMRTGPAVVAVIPPPPPAAHTRAHDHERTER